MKSTRLGALAAILTAGVAVAAQSPSNRDTLDDLDLLRGVDQVRSGDFSAAVVSLDAAIQTLGREPQRPKDLARAYVYQGVAYLEMEEEGLAKEKFRLALRHDGSMRLDRREFSAQQIRTFAAVLGELEVAAPSPSRRGGARKTFAIVGGGAIVASGLAVAAASMGSDPPPTTTTLSAAQCATGPIPQWVTPADRATVSGAVNLVCSLPAGYLCAGQSVNFERCNGNCLGMSATNLIPIGGVGSTAHPTYAFTWDSTAVPNGSQTVFCWVRIFGANRAGHARLVEVRN